MRISPQLTRRGIKRAAEHGFFPQKDRALAERELADLGKAGLK
jgi:hypothetical protein